MELRKKVFGLEFEAERSILSSVWIAGPSGQSLAGLPDTPLPNAVRLKCLILINLDLNLQLGEAAKRLGFALSAWLLSKNGRLNLKNIVLENVNIQTAQMESMLALRAEDGEAILWLKSALVPNVGRAFSLKRMLELKNFAVISVTANRIAENAVLRPPIGKVELLRPLIKSEEVQNIGHGDHRYSNETIGLARYAKDVADFFMPTMLSRLRVTLT